MCWLTQVKPHIIRLRDQNKAFIEFFFSQVKFIEYDTGQVYPFTIHKSAFKLYTQYTYKLLLKISVKNNYMQPMSFLVGSTFTLVSWVGTELVHELLQGGPGVEMLRKDGELEDSKQIETQAGISCCLKFRKSSNKSLSWISAAPLQCSPDQS